MNSSIIERGRSEERSTTAYFEQIKRVALRLLEYCRKRDWAGYDPYDALNSRLFHAFSFLDFGLARLALTQIVKRCPINLRPLLLVPKTQNPKGIALFLSALVKLGKSGLVKTDSEIRAMADLLLALRSPGQRRFCWGYSFDWQTRDHLVPKGFPNIICTTFAANALLDAYELTANPGWLEAAVEAADFVFENLFVQQLDGKGRIISFFRYTALDTAKIHNANLLGAALLSRVSHAYCQKRFSGPSLDAARYSVSKQQEDGSWAYGEGPHQAWVDNFHSGFNLVALKRLSTYLESSEFEEAMCHGLKFYTTHFFCDNGAPRYFDNATYPIDIHSIAQTIITFIEFSDTLPSARPLAQRTLEWGLTNMYDPRGFFYFQKRTAYVTRTPFMRWSQAWMLLALSTYLSDFQERE